MKDVITRKSNPCNVGFLRHCVNCGLEWEVSQEHESCPLAELETELFPCFLDELPHHPDPSRHPISIN